jgi:hypothetical protein
MSEAFNGPVWPAKPDIGSRSVDQLGVRQPGLTLADRLLPGLTNTTNQIRYYSVIAWIAANATSKRHERVLENAFVQAVRLHHEGSPFPRAVVGRNKVPKPEGGRWPIVSEEPIPSVLEPAQYGPSVTALGLANFRTRKRTRQFAEVLAALSGVSGSAVPKGDTEFLSRAQVRALTPLCLCNKPSRKERNLLLELMFRLEGRDDRFSEENSDGPRRRGLALVLDACEGRVDNEVDILQRVLDWAMGRGGYDPPNELEETAELATALALRRHFRFALEVVWRAFGYFLDLPSAGLSLDPYVSRVVKKADGSGAWTPARQAKLSEVVARFSQKRIGLENEGSDKLEVLVEEDPAAALLAAGVQLAVVVRSTRIVQGRHPELARHLCVGDASTVPLATFVRETDSDPRVDEWIERLIERYAVAQHYYTAARKWAEASDAFFFHSTERGFERVNRWRRWEADGGRTKIPAAVSLLEGLALINRGNGKLKPTSEGRAIVERVLEGSPT